MKLISWNVNGLRSVLNKGALTRLIAMEAPDVLCLQETKASPGVVEMAWAEGYEIFWNVAERKGYSGTVTMTRTAPRSVETGIGMAGHDREGRVLTAHFDSFTLVNVYVPNSKRDLSRLEYRQHWDREFLAYLKRLHRRKAVVFCGDLNVAHTELDLARPKQNTRTHGFTAEERAGLDAIVKAGFVDTFRVFEKGGGHYTWWSQMTDARARNIGWRIDAFLISKRLVPQLRSARILKEIKGSDHCPVSIELDGV